MKPQERPRVVTSEEVIIHEKDVVVEVEPESMEQNVNTPNYKSPATPSRISTDWTPKTQTIFSSPSPMRPSTKSFTDAIVNGLPEDVYYFIQASSDAIPFKSQVLDPLTTYMCHSSFKRIRVYTPLAFCVVFGDLEKVELLLGDPKRRFLPKENDTEAVLFACKLGRPRIIKMLLLLPSVRRSVSRNNNEAIRWAMYNRNVLVATEILNSPDFDPSFGNDLLLRGAALRGYVELVDALLKHPLVNVTREVLENAFEGDSMRVVESVVLDTRIKASELSVEQFNQFLKWAKRTSSEWKHLERLMFGDVKVIRSVVAGVYTFHVGIAELPRFKGLQIDEMRLSHTFAKFLGRDIEGLLDVEFTVDAVDVNEVESVSSFIGSLSSDLKVFFGLLMDLLKLKWLEIVLSNFKRYKREIEAELESLLQAKVGGSSNDSLAKSYSAKSSKVKGVLKDIITGCVTSTLKREKICKSVSERTLPLFVPNCPESEVQGLMKGIRVEFVKGCLEYFDKSVVEFLFDGFMTSVVELLNNAVKVQAQAQAQAQESEMMDRVELIASTPKSPTPVHVQFVDDVKSFFVNSSIRSIMAKIERYFTSRLQTVFESQGIVHILVSDSLVKEIVRVWRAKEDVGGEDYALEKKVFDNISKELLIKRKFQQIEKMKIELNSEIENFQDMKKMLFLRKELTKMLKEVTMAMINADPTSEISRKISKLEKEFNEIRELFTTKLKLLNNGELRYEGEWKDNKFEGPGKLFYRNGGKLIFEGNFTNGLKNGNGIQYIIDSTTTPVRVSGFWKNDVLLVQNIDDAFINTALVDFNKEELEELVYEDFCSQHFKIEMHSPLHDTVIRTSSTVIKTAKRSYWARVFRHPSPSSALELVGSEEALLQVAKTALSYHHKSIAKCYGVCKEAPKRGLLMEPFQSNLYNVLMKKKFRFHERMKFLKQITQGLAFLHDQNVLYEELCCENIFLDVNMDCKVVTVGKVEAGDYYRAPELLMAKSPASYKTDVFAFGVITFIILFRCNYEMMPKYFYKRPSQVNQSWKPKIPVDNFEKLNERMKKLLLMMARCFDTDPSKRPTFHECKKEILQVELKEQREINEIMFKIT